MAAVEPGTKCYAFDSFLLDATKRLLSRDGLIVPLTPKAFDVLLLLVANNGRVITKDELLEKVWAGSFVEESNLSQNIFTLRKALGESSREHRFIVTVPGRGYRFVAEVNEIPYDRETNSIAATVSQASQPGLASQDGSTESESKRRTQRQIATFWQKRSVAAASFGLFVVFCFGLYAWFSRKSKPPESVQEVRSIAVLPFQPLGHWEGDEHLGAQVYLGLGQKKLAIEWFNKAYNERSNAMIALKVDPAFDGLRSEPKFQELLRRVGF